MGLPNSPVSQGLNVAASTSESKTKTDYMRWIDESDELAFKPAWDSRTVLIAKFIKPDTSVLEFGAGKCKLKALLPSGCSYTPSDLFPRSEDTLVLNLNGDTLDELPPHDVAVFSGVLEYVEDIPRLARKLAGCVQTVLASYAVTDKNPDLVSRVKAGWLNHFSTAELEAHFKEVGFTCIKKGMWNKQVIFTFQRD